MNMTLASEMGRDAYNAGKPRSANPFNFAAQRSKYLAWDKSWEREWSKDGGDEDSNKTLA